MDAARNHGNTAPRMRPKKPRIFGPDGERAETRGIQLLWRSHTHCKHFHKCYIFLKREERVVGLLALTCSVHPIK